MGYQLEARFVNESIVLDRADLFGVLLFRLGSPPFYGSAS